MLLDIFDYGKPNIVFGFFLVCHSRGGFIKKLITKIPHVDRYPIIFCVSQCSGKYPGLELSNFEEMYGITLAFSKGRNFDSQQVKSLEKLIADMKAELKCKHVLLVDCHVFQSKERSFRFFSHRENTDMTSVGFMLKGTVEYQTNAVLEKSPITCETKLVDHFDDRRRKVHCYQISFSTKLIADKKNVGKSRKTKFEMGLYAGAVVAMTKMRIDADPDFWKIK
ncbi:hypothetical protein CIK05_06595 [Bdellovibrio sp. qaytius]|nr:hypothetical protein CIK05_06595 [Bdellovibrio sp. qaytius]